MKILFVIALAHVFRASTWPIRHPPRSQLPRTECRTSSDSLASLAGPLPPNSLHTVSLDTVRPSYTFECRTFLLATKVSRRKLHLELLCLRRRMVLFVRINPSRQLSLPSCSSGLAIGTAARTASAE